MKNTQGRPVPQQRPIAGSFQSVIPAIKIPKLPKFTPSGYETKRMPRLEEITRLVTIASEMKHHEDCKTVLDYLLELLVFDEVAND